MENELLVQKIASSINLEKRRVKATLDLLKEGATIPFIARYRKEQTGSLDEVAICAIQEEHNRLLKLEERREFILSAIESSGQLTSDLKTKIKVAKDLTDLEDLYLPYKSKRRTKAAVARERGLEPLADMILRGRLSDSLKETDKFIRGEISHKDEAIAGAKDIIAEKINEDPRVRNGLRNLFARTAVLCSEIPKGKIAAASNYDNYNGFSRALRGVSSHQFLAITRAEREGLLKVKIDCDMEKAASIATRYYLSPSAGRLNCEVISDAAADSLKRLLKPSLENELRSEKKIQADKEAISLFANNLEQLLMSSPLGEKEVLAIDPGYRTGCKVVCLDAGGKLLEECVIYPTQPQNDIVGATATLKKLISLFNIKAIAIGDGTAGRETFSFVKSLNLEKPVEIYGINENGASVYSASEIAREEFPDKDITVRGAVSIGRRLQDPLAELVKIDPKSIGVGQYQHDVDQKALKESLDFTVSGVVNRVGVNVNTASAPLLSYISGIGQVLSKNIIDYRTKNGPFKDRYELLKVPRLGAKAFEQAAGFLRIVDGENPLDNTRIHPESYPIVEKISKDYKIPVSRLIGNDDILDKLNIEDYITEKFGRETVRDIIMELKRPGLDPRSENENMCFSEEIQTISDIRIGMILPAKVNNITAFGAFVDLGIKENGLIHISNISKHYIKSPADILKIGQKVTVEVLDVDEERKRIGLRLIAN